MAKCIKCGKSTLARGHVKLADAMICTPCFKKLGFKITADAPLARAWIYDDIKDGKENVERNRYIRAKKHEKWLEEHPEVSDLMAAIDEGNEPDADVETDESEEV